MAYDQRQIGYGSPGFLSKGHLPGLSNHKLKSNSMTPVITRSYHNSRSCANSKETVLNVSNVTQRGIKKLFSLPIPGDKRGCEAQPLIAPNVTIADGSSHDLVILATMVNTVLAYDAHDGTLIW